MSSPATNAAGAAVRQHDNNCASNIKKEDILDEDEEAAMDCDVDEDNDCYDTTRPSTMSPNFSPRPTLTLPPNYSFRTTEAGYPNFRAPKIKFENQPRRASMTTAQGFMDPRISSFIDCWTRTYTETGNDPEGRAEGMFQLRLACKERRLVTYGPMELLVARLVDRALRDAVRGWSETLDSVGRIKYEEAPGLPNAMVSVEEQDIEEEEVKKEDMEQEMKQDEVEDVERMPWYIATWGAT